MVYKHAVSDNEKNDAFGIRYQIYCIEKGWLPFDDYINNLESDIYDQSSENFIAVTDEGEPVGTIRVIFNSSAGFQISNCFEVILPEGGQGCAEISRLAVLKEYRSRHIEIRLFREALQYCLKNSVSHYYAVVENNTFKFLRRLGLPFEVIGDAKYYLGGNTFPVYMNLQTMIQNLEKNNPNLLSFIMNQQNDT